MKKQPTEWEKIFVNKATDNGLISKIYKQAWNSIQKQIFKKDIWGKRRVGVNV